MTTDVDILIPETGGGAKNAARGGAGGIAETVAESLRAHGLRVEVMDEGRVINDEPGFIRTLKAKIAECRPRMVMPVFKSEIIARHRHELPDDIIIPISSADILEELDDKCSASALAGRLDIPQPRLYRDDELDSIGHYPVVFKRNRGLSGSGVYFPRNREALDKLVGSAGGHPHLVCDFIDGYDISVDAVRMNGYFHAECYRILKPEGKGISTLRQSVERPDIVAFIRQILDECDYHGVCGADFRICRSCNDKAFFMECNPRFSGGLTTQIAAGFDLPYILWQLATGQSPAPIAFKNGLVEGITQQRNDTL